MKTVKTTRGKDYRKDTEAQRLAGGFGPFPAKQTPEALLRRAVMGCLLWEDLAYESGEDNASNIRELVPLVDPDVCYSIAVEAREMQKLRHVPLYITSIMAGIDTHKHLVGSLLPKVIRRADELAEFLAIYWREGRQPLSKQVKVGLAEAFHNFNEYQFSKYKGNRNDVKLRDVLRLVHPTPKSTAESDLFGRIARQELKTPDTWEVALSSGKDKKETWERLIGEGKLGALAFLRNLRNMRDAGVSEDVIRYGFNNLDGKWLLPLNYYSAGVFAPEWKKEITKAMIRSLGNARKLSGHTVFVVDVSGSMGASISSRSNFDRLDVACALAMFAREVCESISIYVTSGSDWERRHATELLEDKRGFELVDLIKSYEYSLGGGGIFTRQCLEYIKENNSDKNPDRIMVFSDSEDCDDPRRGLPDPFGKRNYIIDVSAHKNGINYDGLWDAEISGWSEHFISFVASLEGISLQPDEELN